jgi:ABC-type cobalamin/Fe3+-siderophores transport system ATPase subunit
MSRPSTLQLPPSISDSLSSITNLISSLVIIGANGSGKTRLGAWLEFNGPQKHLVYRVGAQKTLAFPDSTSPTALDDAMVSLSSGVDTSSDNIRKNRDYYMSLPGRLGSKWNGDAATGIVNDYNQLLVYLVSEQYEVVLAYAQQAKSATTYTAPNDTKLDRIKFIWEQVIAHRQLVIKASTISVKIKDSPDAAAYKASLMSDGERAAFYLIGQCLAAPANSIIVVDEPEVHLHRIVQSSLWNAIEQERPDCLFVYLTHDLDFAASRNEAKKVWIKSYSGQAWDWREVPSEAEGLPEEVLLAVLGSRRPVLFTEGDRGGTEQALFSHLYPGWTIMPRGGCEQVIQATQAFRALRHLHGIDSHGIVDLDYRSVQEKLALSAVGVHALDVQEIENLLLIEPVLRLVATHLYTNSLVADTPDEIVRKVKEFAFATLGQDKDLLASRKTAWALEQQLHKIDRTVRGIAALEAVRTRATQFDVAGTYTAFAQEIDRIIATQDYAALLHLYNNKGLARQVGRFFGVLSYPELVKRLISNINGAAIVVALQAAAPQLPAVAIGTPTTAQTA